MKGFPSDKRPLVGLDRVVLLSFPSLLPQLVEPQSKDAIEKGISALRNMGDRSVLSLRMGAPYAVLMRVQEGSECVCPNKGEQVI